MLPPFIIDQIRRREDKVQDAPVRQLPLPMPMPQPRSPNQTGEEDQNRGVVIIDLGG